MTTEILVIFFFQHLSLELIQAPGQRVSLFGANLRFKKPKKNVKSFSFCIFSLLVGLVFLTACSTSSSSTDVGCLACLKLKALPTMEIFQNPKKVVNFAYSYTGYLLQLGIKVSSYSLDLEKDSPAFW